MKSNKTPATKPPADDRRNPQRQQVRTGGARATDPPLTPRECADWMGLTTSSIRNAIHKGVTVNNQAVVKLEAERVHMNGRPVYRVHLDHFVAFLRAIGWKRLPAHHHRWKRVQVP